MSEYAKRLFEIAQKWQKAWRESRIFEADPREDKPKFFLTAAFPYPNSPLHLGHGRTYTITDAYARYLRMKGYNVLFPMGFHYTGTPILTMAEQIASGDKELIDLMINVYDVPPEDIEKLKDPLSLARYFHTDAKNAMMEMGYSIDWRREFTSIDPEFKKFITWQFIKLREKGLVTKGTHPVGWCPKHGMPVGMHDTKGDVEPEIGEFTLILFKLSDFDYYLPAATLRPETVFGVTNIWVNPDAEYSLVIIDGKKYIVSKRAAFKLRFQRDNVAETKTLKGSELVGKWVINPATGEKVPILPASFVDPDTATGVVMSVPAHAPYDYVALRDLIDNNSELLSKLGIDPERLKPIPLIRVPGYGEIPAKDIVEKMGIKSQLEKDKLDEATKTLYSDEFNKGIMRTDIINRVYQEVPEEYRKFIVAALKAWILGRPVREARDAVAKWLTELGYGDKMYEIMNRPVYCRCGTEIVVKVLKDQWFINYGDPAWKQRVLELLKEMRIVPEIMRDEFIKVVDWLRERAAARTRGLGTELPWAPGWIIESLSDSTIYMAFYTVIHKIRSYGLKADQLAPSFWDYVLLGKGNVTAVSRETSIPVGVLEDLRREFEYWYPLDSRHSGRDLVPNHLTFFLFNHVAIFPRDKWPRQIVVNGFVLLEGKKMSKSLRNIVPLRRALRVYGVDTVRATLLAAAEILQDANFTEELARSVMSQLRKIEQIVSELRNIDSETTIADRWLVSRLQKHIEQVTNAFDGLRIRAATVRVLYEMENDAKKYLEIRGRPGPALREYVDAWIRMLAPIAPHLAEELWHSIGKQGFVSVESWPLPDSSKIDDEAELAVSYVDKVVEDIKAILRIYRGEPHKVVLIVEKPEAWKYASLVASVIINKGQMRDAIKALMNEGLGGKQAAALAKKLFEYMRGLDEETIRRIASIRSFNEREVLKTFSGYIASRIGIENVEVISVDEAGDNVPKQKLAAVIPGRPAIVIS
ncbi:leucine--tRNA ligase [Pyrofollis japonicus]|uniref:leucine--tRNA ligase n=1 Tax=Pyrofollis japonicus TaxID=3060460 RepID=UPI0037C9D9BF